MFRESRLFAASSFFVTIILLVLFIGGFTAKPSLSQVISATPDPQPFPTPPPPNDCVNLVLDSGFEAYTPNPFWQEASTNFNTPICTESDCGSGTGTAGPHTGFSWAWLGGTSNNEAASLSQVIEIPRESSILEFYFWIGYAGEGAGLDDVFTLKIDDSTLFTANATESNLYPQYTQIQVAAEAYADGGEHLITVASQTSGQVVNFSMDDVKLCANSSSPLNLSNRTYLPLIISQNAQLTSVDEMSTLEANILFADPLSVSEAIQIADDAEVNPVMLESDFQLGDALVHDFFILDTEISQPNIGDVSQQVEEDYLENRLAFFADMLATEDELGPEEKTQLQAQFESMRMAISDLQAPPLLINSMIVYADPVKINALRIEANNSIEEIIIDTKDQPSSATLAGEVNIISESDAARISSPQAVAADPAWYPNLGYSFTDPSQYGGRYTTQYMKWDNASFGSNQTYEHDFFLYNYDGQAYLNPGSTSYPGCMPVVNYAATSWPAEAKPYLDTRLKEPPSVGCETEEVPYTIGAAQANQLSSSIWYYNYIRTSEGNAETDRFKVQAQLGHRTPSDCYTTWCSFGDEILNLVPAWNDNIPGTLIWSRVASCPDSQYYVEYYKNQNLDGSPASLRCENWPIMHDWGSGGPGLDIGVDKFSARWTGSGYIESGDYTFIALADDGIRVWLDNSLIINAWKDQPPTEYRVTRYVNSGMHDIKVEYYENGGGAIAQFRWEKQVVGNLALGKATYASSIEQGNNQLLGPSNATDGQIGTRWSSRQAYEGGQNFEWIYVNLGGWYNVNEVILKWETAYAKHYNIQIWNGYQWVIVDTNSNGKGGTETRTIPSINTCCVAIVGEEKVNSSWGYSLWEFEVYGVGNALSENSSLSVIDTELPPPLSEGN